MLTVLALSNIKRLAFVGVGVVNLFTSIFCITEKEEEIQKLSSSVKNLKQERKKLEGNLTSFEETVSDLKQEKESLEKVSCWPARINV